MAQRNYVHLALSSFRRRYRFRKMQLKQTSERQMSQLIMRLWYFSSSVNSFFKRACAAIQWG